MSDAPLGHTPVMLHEVLAAIRPRPAGSYIDGTVDGGGHAAAILAASAPDGRLLGLDCDPAAAELARRTLAGFGDRAVIEVAHFLAMGEIGHRRGFVPADGILLDLGLSSHHLADPNRGFSFRMDGPLDMRFDPRIPITADDLVNGLSEDELADLIFRYGEERLGRRIARAIVAARPMHRTTELAEVVSKAVAGRGDRLRACTRVFQALRIRVNDELDSLARVLPLAISLLAAGGRLVVLSFHSLEDRIVKRILGQAAAGCVCPPEALECRCSHQPIVQLVSRRALRPSNAEQVANPRSRSARLRAAERLPTPITHGVFA